ncbi:MAG: cellulose binding domain-containing protein [Oscillospiraceae bacterium]
MIMNMTSIFTTTIFAADAKNSSYSGENYKVNYSIQDSWDNNQMIEVKLTNTGTQNIENWALKFNADGEIKDIIANYLKC